MIIKELWSDRLLYAAQALVVIATAIGLLLSWSMGQELLTHDKDTTAFNLLMTILPFIIVSLIEFTKVPLVKKIYKSATGKENLQKCRKRFKIFFINSFIVSNSNHF